MNKFENSVFNAISQYRMFNKNDKVLIALSGGKDSVALLLFLAAFSQRLGISLFAAHVNHMIRGEDADADQSFCEKLCSKYNIPFFAERFNVPKIASEISLSLEEAARNVRYGYFEKLCREYNIDRIATAHTASDNTETVLYNMMRGSGTRGICGIPPVRDNIVRPLIFCTKEDTEKYCFDNNTDFCTDITNNDDSYDRNNIRINIVPHMKKRNASIDNSIAHLSHIARCDRMLISSLADIFLEKHPLPFDLEETAEIFADEKMTSCAHEILSRVCGFALPYDIFLQCKSVILSKKTGKRVKLREEMYMVIEYNKIKIEKEYVPVPPYKCVLSVGQTHILNDKVKIRVDKTENVLNYKNINNLTKNATLNFDTIYGDIFARKRQDGDSYISGGMTRSVKKFFTDNKFSRRLRDMTPVICDEKGIIWVPGMRVCDRVISKNNGNNIIITVEFTDEE